MDVITAGMLPSGSCSTKPSFLLQLSPSECAFVLSYFIAWADANQAGGRTREPTPAPLIANAGPHPTPVLNNSAATGGIVGADQV
jgi:hypothetical protein